MKKHVCYIVLTLFTCLCNAQENTDSIQKSYDLKEIPISFNRARIGDPITFVNISKKEIEKYNLGQDVPILLEKNISMTATSDAGNGVGYSYLRMRGVDQTRINVTINGMPYNDPESHQVFWVNLPDLLSSADQIQIQRGLGSSNNGAGSFGGTINIFTNAIKKEALFATAHSYGSYNTQKNNLMFQSGLLKNAWTFNGRLSRIVSDGYVDRASSAIYSYFFNTAWLHKKTNIQFNHFYGTERTYQSWYGIPQDSLKTNPRLNTSGTDFGKRSIPYNNEIDRYSQWHFQLVLQQELTSKWNCNAMAFYVKGKGYYEQYKVEDALANYGITPQIINADTMYTSDIVRRRNLSNHFFGSNVSFTYTGSRSSFIAAAGWNRYIGDHFGTIHASSIALSTPASYRYYDATGTKNDMNVYAIYTYKIAASTQLYADIQYRNIIYNIGGINDTRLALSSNKVYHFFNPKLGLQSTLANKHKIQLFAGIGHHEPVRDDFVQGNPKPERMLNVEASYIFTTKKYDAGINFYFMGYQDQLVLTGAINDVGAAIRTNVDKSYRVGAEVFTRLQPNKYIQFNANATFSINKIVSHESVINTYDENYTAIDSLQIRETLKHRDISFSPAIIAYADVVLTPFKGFRFTLSNKYTGRQFIDNTQSTSRMLKSYNIMNVNIEYALPIKSNDDYIFTLMLNNITNRKYASNGYTFSERYAGTGYLTDIYQYNYVYAQAPFNFMLGFVMKIR